MKLDYQKFANEGFLRTINQSLLHDFLQRHAIPSIDLDADLLLTDPAAGRAALAAFLLGPVERCPESLTADLHRMPNWIGARVWTSCWRRPPAPACRW